MTLWWRRKKGAGPMNGRPQTEKTINHGATQSVAVMGQPTDGIIPPTGDDLIVPLTAVPPDSTVLDVTQAVTNPVIETEINPVTGPEIDNPQTQAPSPVHVRTPEGRRAISVRGSAILSSSVLAPIGMEKMAL